MSSDKRLKSRLTFKSSQTFKFPEIDEYFRTTVFGNKEDYLTFPKLPVTH